MQRQRLGIIDAHIEGVAVERDKALVIERRNGIAHLGRPLGNLKRVETTRDGRIRFVKDGEKSVARELGVVACKLAVGKALEVVADGADHG